jgi:hypothetical protein
LENELMRCPHAYNWVKHAIALALATGHLPLIAISINRDTGVRRAIYGMNSGIFNNVAAALF